MPRSFPQFLQRHAFIGTFKLVNVGTGRGRISILDAKTVTPTSSPYGKGLTN